jgi:protein MAK16
MVTVNHALEKRERNREAKAMTAARLEKSLEQELVSRLKSRAYGDAPLNVNEEVWAKILEADRAGPGGEELMEDETDEEDEEELEREFVSDVEESEDEEGFEDWAGRPDVRALFLLSRPYIFAEPKREQLDLSDLDEEELSDEEESQGDEDGSGAEEGGKGPSPSKKGTKRPARSPPRPERKKPRSKSCCVCACVLVTGPDLSGFRRRAAGRGRVRARARVWGKRPGCGLVDLTDGSFFGTKLGVACGSFVRSDIILF